MSLQLQPLPPPAAGPAPAFSILDDTGLGWRRVALGLVTDDAEYLLEDLSAGEREGRLEITGTYDRGTLQETVCLEPCGDDGVVLTRRLESLRVEPLVVPGAFGEGFGADGGPVLPGVPAMDMRFAHPDNVRLERFPWCRLEFPYVRPLPIAPTWYGDQESQAVPALVITDENADCGLVVGQLDQRLSRLRFRLAAHSRRQLGTFRVEWRIQTGGQLVQQGQSIAWEPVFIQLQHGVTWADAFTDYLEQVAARHDFRLQQRNPLHGQAFYCSWNYGIMRDFTQDSLLATARAIHEHFPNIRYFLVDGGWQSRERLDCPDCANFYRADQLYHHAAILPEGMGELARRFRELGLLPAIWWTPSVDMSSTLAHEHPEWLAKDAAGGPHRISRSGYLDYSLPEVQEYLHKCFRIIFREWGYVAMKMDFWSQSAESDHIRFRSGHGIQWRDWLLETIQSYLPEDGFLMTCVATSMGNPFVTRYAQTYRACIDIGNFVGWREHLHASAWVQPLLGLPQRRLGLLNVDGLGVSEHVSDDENLHRLTYGFITMGSLEIDGRLEQLSPRHRDWLQRLTAHVDRGYRVRCPEREVCTGEPLPGVLYVDYPAESPTRQRGVRKHVALLNWEDRPRLVGATNDELGLPAEVTMREFWTDETRTFRDTVSEVLPAHGARLYELAD